MVGPVRFYTRGVRSVHKTEHLALFSVSLLPLPLIRFLRPPLFSTKVVSKPRMLSVRADYVLSLATTSSIFTVTYDVPLSVNIPFGFRCLVSATVRADGPRLRLLSSSIGDFVFTRQRPNETDRRRSGGRGKGVSAPSTRFRRPDRGCDFRHPDFCQRILYVDRLP